LIKGLPHNFYFQDTISTSQRRYHPFCAAAPRPDVWPGATAWRVRFTSGWWSGRWQWV